MSQLDDRFEHHSPVPEGSSAQVETTDEVRITTPEEYLWNGASDEA